MLSSSQTTNPPVGGAPYHRIAISAGLLAPVALGMLYAVAWLLQSERVGEICGSICCYISALSALASLVAGTMARRERPESPALAPLLALAITLAVLTTLTMMLMYLFQQGYGVMHCQLNCMSAMRRLYPIQANAVFPDVAYARRHLHCSVILELPPWLPPAPRPAGMNVHVAGKTLKEIPHPERTVFLADCVSPDGRITGLKDIAWGRHTPHNPNWSNILLCDGTSWNPDSVKREELIFKP